MYLLSYLYKATSVYSKNVKLLAQVNFAIPKATRNAKYYCIDYWRLLISVFTFLRQILFVSYIPYFNFYRSPNGYYYQDNGYYYQQDENGYYYQQDDKK